MSPAVRVNHPAVSKLGARGTASDIQSSPGTPAVAKYPAERRGDPDGTSRVGADGKRNDLGGDGHGRSAARAAGRAAGEPRMLAVAVVGVFARESPGELKELGLARP